MPTNTSYTLGAYWGARRESVDACADRLSRFVRELRACDPAFAVWFGGGRSRAEALRNRVEAGDRVVVRQLLEQGRNRRETDGSVIEELGFGTGFWNGAEEGKGVSLSVTCGLYAQVRDLSNCVVLKLPRELGELSRAENLARVVAATVRAWEPDWARVISRQALKTAPIGVPFADWMLYVPRQIAAPDPPASVLPVEGYGSLLLLQRTPPETVDAFLWERVSALLAHPLPVTSSYRM